MSVRHLILVVFMGVVLALAGLLALGWPIWWLTPIHWLGQYPLFHIVGHFSIFAGVVFLYGPQKRKGFRLWVIVLSGSILLECIQIAAAGVSLTRPLLLDSLFDVVVDSAGAAGGWLIMRSRFMPPTNAIVWIGRIQRAQGSHTSPK